MSPNDPSDGCMRLSEFYASRHDERRGYEWKMTLGLWAAMLASVSILLDLQQPLSCGVRWGASAGLVIITLLYGFSWLKPLWEANKKDKDWAFHYADQATMILLDPKQTPQKPDKEEIEFWDFLKDWSMRFQFLITVILTIFAVVYIITGTNLTRQ